MITLSAATQPHNLPLHVTTEKCSGRTYIVTGANTGLGFEAVKHLVLVGAAKVIMAVRNPSSGEAARADIEAGTGISNVAEVWALDLSSYESVKAFAKRAITELDRIDSVIENAAVAHSTRDLAEGHARSLTVNVYSTFLLAVLLLPKLSESAKRFGTLPHLAVVTSSVSFGFEHVWNKVKDDPLPKLDAENMDAMATYPLSKLLEILAVRHLAKHLPVSRTGVVVNLVCPGLCKTDLSRNATAQFRENLAAEHQKYGRTAEDGSRTLLHGAVAGKESHGLFLSSCELAENATPDWVNDEAVQESQKLVWGQIAQELESIESGCVNKALKLCN